MSHPDRPTAADRPRRLMAAALAFVWVSLLVVAAPIGVAAKGPSITLTADRQTVNAGDNDTLRIKLQNVTNATLNGAALAAGKDQVDKKVLVCATTTYTVTALPTDGGPKISQALTITANGTTSKAACVSPTPMPAAVSNPLPDLVVASLTLSESWDMSHADVENVRANYTIENQGQAPAAGVQVLVYFNGMPQNGGKFDLNVGEEKSGHVSMPFKDYDHVMVAVVIGEENTIAESDKTNNAAVANVTVVLGTNSTNSPVDLSKTIESDRVKLHGDTNLFKLIKP
jgi:hypothetical protein